VPAFPGCNLSETRIILRRRLVTKRRRPIDPIHAMRFHSYAEDNEGETADCPLLERFEQHFGVWIRRLGPASRIFTAPCFQVRSIQILRRRETGRSSRPAMKSFRKRARGTRGGGACSRVKSAYLAADNAFPLAALSARSNIRFCRVDGLAFFDQPLRSSPSREISRPPRVTCPSVVLCALAHSAVGKSRFSENPPAPPRPRISRVTARSHQSRGCRQIRERHKIQMLSRSNVKLAGSART